MTQNEERNNDLNDEPSAEPTTGSSAGPDADGALPPGRFRGRFGLFLAVLTAGFLVSGFGGTWASAVGLAMSALLGVVAFRNARMIRDGRMLAAFIVVSLGATTMIVLLDGDSAWRAVPMFLQAGLLGLLVAVTVLAALRRRRVDLQTILAAISAYVLIGFVYAWVYFGIDVIDEDQFSMSATDSTQFFEFSFVVQTTLGFGDQIPTASFAARLVVTQAIIGQMFLATLVARFVSLYGVTKSRPDADDAP